MEKELKKIFGFEAGVEAIKKRIFKELVEAIREGDSERSIQRLIRSGEFTETEIEEAYKHVKK